MFLHVTHANGQTSEIPIHFADGYTLDVRDEKGAVVGSVSFANVTDFNLSVTSLYAVAEEPPVEPEPIAAEPERVAETEEALTEPAADVGAEDAEPAEPADAEPEPESAVADDGVTEPVAKPRRSFGKK